MSPFVPSLRGLVFGVVTVATLFPGAVSAQRRTAQDTVPRDTLVYRGNAIVVTATRSPRMVFVTPSPVVVLDTSRLARSQANTVTDAFRDVPGLDVNGVGVQQPRPIIRGQRGQRILLLQDGLRLNNSRRQQDFGEIPSLVSPSEVERVEVVRGPASVLYGTDAIGGVVNIITKRPTQEGWHGTVAYRYGEEESQNRGDATVTGRFGKFDLLLDGSLRDAGNYRAPAGTFGAIHLVDPTVVHATGVKDRSFGIRAGFEPSAGQSLFARFETYHSEDAGFGYVDPSAYAPEQPKIDITYPFQTYRRVTLGYSGADLGSALADRLDVLAYGQSNERRLVFDLFTGFGPQAPPGAGVGVVNRNWSDLGTVGFRVEAKKLAVPGVLLTYGVDMFRDKSRNTDLDSTSVVGFGPPQIEVNTNPQVPDATYRSVGAFVQSELELGRATVILGGRAQDLRANTQPGVGLSTAVASKTVSTAVGSANVLYALTPGLTLVGTVGRAFRAPNLIEWFFEGATPEGNGYQVRSPDLKPEHSLNVDLGFRFRRGRVSGEAFVYRNVVSDGIRIAPTGDTVSGLPAYQNVNVEKLLFRGIEASARLALVGGLSAEVGATKMSTQDQLDPSNPIGDSFSSKLTGSLLYRDAGDRFWAEYAVRHNGERKDVSLLENPLGDLLPSFTVHALRGGITVLRGAGTTQRLGVAVENLTNTLYAEFTNASFFRPEPRRRVTLSWDVSF